LIRAIRRAQGLSDRGYAESRIWTSREFMFPAVRE
jgi:hypothetical protein